MAEVASIAAANEDIWARVEAAFEESLRRYEYTRLMARTDDVLAILEELNLRGVVIVPADLRQCIRCLLEELPEACRMALSQDPRTQRVLESIYVVQDRLLNRKHPGRQKLLTLDLNEEEVV